MSPASRAFRWGWAVWAGVLLLHSGPAPAQEASEPLLFDVASIQSLTLAELLERAESSRVIFFGERHGKREDHRAQLQFLRALRQRTPHLAVALEVFGFASQEALDRFSGGRAGEEELRREFGRNAAPSLYPHYRDLLFYCRDHGIPLVGIRADTAPLVRLFFEGAGDFSPEELARDLPGYHGDCEVSPKYESFMRLFAETTPPFSELGPERGHPCDFFMGLDSTMAYAIARYLRRHPERKVLVLAGAFHAWKQGIPFHLRRHVDVAVSVILPSSARSEFLGYDVFAQDADFVWWHR